MLLTAIHGRFVEQGGSAAPARADAPILESQLADAGFASDRLTTADRRLLRLLSAFDLTLRLLRMPDEAVWLAVIRYENAKIDGEARTAETCVGKGLQPADAVRACLGEFAEYRSWLADGSEPVHYRMDMRCRDPVLTPQMLLPFSPQQWKMRDRFNATWQGYDYVPEFWQDQHDLAWCAVHELHKGGLTWAPACLCYGRAPASWSLGSDAYRADSNGCAAGETLTSAIAAGLLELIERDALGIWWYAQCRRPELSLETTRIDIDGWAKQRSAQSRRRWLLDLTTDLGVPVVAAISVDREGRLPAIGAGASTSLSAAAMKAFLELCQAELNVHLSLQRWRERSAEELADSDRIYRRWLLRMSLEALPWLVPDDRVSAEQETAPVLEAFLTQCLNKVRAKGLHAYWLDLTRPAVGVPVARVFVPGLCHVKPRLGAKRLREILHLKGQTLIQPEVEVEPCWF
jgi:ribosomal protein S12 methylthiotransferase accessory factor